MAKELQERTYFLRTIPRNPEKLKHKDIEANEVRKAELTEPDSIKDSCKGMEVAISTVCIKRQKRWSWYMDVDYQANMNLLEEAKRNGVKNPFSFRF